MDIHILHFSGIKADSVGERLTLIKLLHFPFSQASLSTIPITDPGFSSSGCRISLLAIIGKKM